MYLHLINNSLSPTEQNELTKNVERNRPRINHPSRKNQIVIYAEHLRNGVSGVKPRSDSEQCDGTEDGGYDQSWQASSGDWLSVTVGKCGGIVLGLLLETAGTLEAGPEWSLEGGVRA